MRDVIAELHDKLAVPVETAGLALNMGPGGIRAAIRRKEIPTTGCGRRGFMIPTAFLRQRLGLEANTLQNTAA